ncbi:hypothetical protein PYK79_56600, partial [Streptomyces sp. ID05-04B]|uniref:hypothetical protein n=1 Tax=Streptomyces sp. ID05-04B TaxID=3028661 RepID=UPI0029C1B5E1
MPAPATLRRGLRPGSTTGVRAAPHIPLISLHADASAQHHRSHDTDCGNITLRGSGGASPDGTA